MKHSALMCYYSDIAQMVEAMKASAGSDYDIREKITPHSDLVYDRMIEVVSRETGVIPVRKVVVLPVEQKVVNYLSAYRTYISVTVFLFILGCELGHDPNINKKQMDLQISIMISRHLMMN